MTDPILPGQQAAPASAQPEQVAQTTPAQETPKPLTIADVEALVNERATRIAQSMVDKASARLSKEAQNKIDAIRTSANVLGLTPEQVNSASQKVITDDLMSAAVQPASQPAQPEQVSVDPYVAAVETMFASRGLSIDVSDPEYPDFIKSWSDPNGNPLTIGAATETYITRKAARLQEKQDTAPLRVPGGGGGGTQPTTIDAPGRVLLEQAYRK